MDYLKKTYKEKCKFLATSFNFNLYKNNYYRVIDDVFQSFCLHKSISGSECTVEFSVVPLCLGNTIKKSFCGPDHLKMFENDFSWFQYDRSDEISINQCVDLMLEYIRKYLMPYFENANNSKNAYYETCKFQQKHYKGGVQLSNYVLFCMALKAGFYEKCIEHLSAKIIQIEDVYKKNKECLGNQLSVEYERNMLLRIKDIEHQIAMISQGNFNYINNFIVENERLAMLNL